MRPRSRPTAPPATVRWTHPAALASLGALALAVVALQAIRRPDPELWWQLALGGHTLSRGLAAASFGTWFDAGGGASPPHALFATLVRGLWNTAGEWAPFVLRAALALATLAVALLAATRTARAGLPAAQSSRGLASFSLLALAAWCALAARPAWQAHPLQLSALWFALQWLALEDYRGGGRAGLVALPLLAAAWANTDASWLVGLAANVVVLASALSRRDPRARRLGLAVIAAAAASLLQPGGPLAVSELFEFLTRARTETVFRGLPDLRPLDPFAHARTLTPVLILAWPLSRLFSTERPRDPAPLVVAVGLGALAAMAGRFVGLWAVACLALLGRDVVRWSVAGGPLQSEWARAAAAVAICVAAIATHVTDRAARPGVGLDRTEMPASAVDFMRRHGVQGRLFNAAPFGSYLAWSAEKGDVPLPFVDLRFRGTPDDRANYLAAFTRDADWLRLHARHRFDAVVVERYQAPGNTLLDRLDADSTWALVFADDVAAIWVRRDGANATLARERAYAVPVGRRGFDEFVTSVVVDGMELDRRRQVLMRMIGDSPNHRLTLTMLVATEMALGLQDAARLHVRDGLARWPDDRGLRAMLAQMEGV